MPKLDTEVDQPGDRHDELERLAALLSYEILDTPPDKRFDVFVRLAAQLYNVPVSTVSLLDGDRCWYKASVGIDFPSVPRNLAFCNWAIQKPSEVMVVEDLSKDERFADSPFVAEGPELRFYAGAPIVSPGGHALGTICILDTNARVMTDDERQRLADLATGVGCVMDLHLSNVRLRRAAWHDPLTGLANRALFDPAVQDAAHHAREGQPCAVICVDLDRFKAVNDLLGHAAGDSVLQQTASMLRRAVRDTDTVARLGGDEFAILLRSPLEPGGPQAVAERLLTMFKDPMMIEGQVANIGASIGFALAPMHGSDGPTLLRAADAALYRAKGAGRATAMGAHQHAPSILHRSGLAEDLRRAVASRQFTLHWQPTVHLVTGEGGGHEALLRWTRPGHGPVSPEIFIAVGEEAGLAWQIDTWVLETACRAAAAWPTPMPVNVNMTPSSFCSRELSDLVRRVLASTGLAPGRLVLEVTERMAMERPDLARRRIGELHHLGVQVALDDFGNGFSALGSLEEFDFDRVKLDRTFIRNIGRSSRAEAIARSVIELGKDIGVLICAEGVETQEQLSFLHQHGCPMAQGYLLGRPAPEPRFENLGSVLIAAE